MNCRHAWRVRAFTSCMAALCTLLATSMVQAQAWPARPVRYIVPYAAGGPTDIVGRLLAADLQRRWNQQVVVDNRPGANANIGAELAARAAPDGYTLLQGTGSTHGSNPAIYKIGYDPVRDFVAIVPLVDAVVYLAVANSLPVNSVKELVEHARANPGKLNYGTPGAGSAQHLAGELLRQRTGISMVGVHFKGSAPAIQALQAGDVQLVFDSTAVRYAKAGQAKVLAVASRTRWASTPEIPTMIESGVPDFEARGWFGLFAPAGTPQAVVERINRDVNDALAVPDIRKRLTDIGFAVTGGSQAAFAEGVVREIAYWADLVRATNLKVE